MKQGGIAAWNIAPLFKGNAAPCPRPACTLSAAPAPCPGPPAPACTLTASAARSLLGLAAPCPRPACSPAPCPRPTAALCRGQGWQLPAPVPRGTPCCPACPYGSLPACCWFLGWWLLDQRYLNGSPLVLCHAASCPHPVQSCLGLPACLSHSQRLSPVLSRAASFSCPIPVGSSPSSPIPTTPHILLHAGCQMPTGVCGL